MMGRGSLLWKSQHDTLFCSSSSSLSVGLANGHTRVRGREVEGVGGTPGAPGPHGSCFLRPCQLWSTMMASKSMLQAQRPSECSPPRSRSPRSHPPC